jgi:hypothetical protein
VFQREIALLAEGDADAQRLSAATPPAGAGRPRRRRKTEAAGRIGEAFEVFGRKG